MSKSLRILACVYFFFAGVYAIFTAASSISNGIFNLHVILICIVSALIIVSAVIGVIQVFRSILGTVSFMLLPLLLFYVSLLITNASTSSINVVYIIMITFESLFIISILASIIAIKRIGYSIPLTVGAVSSGILAGIVTLGFIGMIIIESTPLFILTYIFLFVFSVFAFVSFLVFYRRREHFFEVNVKSAPAVQKESAPVIPDDQNKNAVAMLKELKALYDSGAITQEEYEEKRKQYVDKL